MPIDIVSLPPDSVAIEINATENKIEVAAGYVGPPFKQILPGDNIDIVETDTTIEINWVEPTKALTNTVKTGNYVLALVDAYTMISMNVGGDNTVTVPPNADVAFDTGTTILISQYGAGTTEIVPGSGVTLRSEQGYVKIAEQYAGVVLTKIGTNEWYLQGALSA